MPLAAKLINSTATRQSPSPLLPLRQTGRGTPSLSCGNRAFLLSFGPLFSPGTGESYGTTLCPDSHRWLFCLSWRCPSRAVLRRRGRCRGTSQRPLLCHRTPHPPPHRISLPRKECRQSWLNCGNWARSIRWLRISSWRTCGRAIPRSGHWWSSSSEPRWRIGNRRPSVSEQRQASRRPVPKPCRVANPWAVPKLSRVSNGCRT